MGFCTGITTLEGTWMSWYSIDIRGALCLMRNCMIRYRKATISDIPDLAGIRKIQLQEEGQSPDTDMDSELTGRAWRDHCNGGHRFHGLSTCLYEPDRPERLHPAEAA